MTTALSTRMVIPHISDSEIDLVCEYTYAARERELTLYAVVTEIGGAEISVYHMLTRDQVRDIQEQCVEDYQDRMASVAERRWEERTWR